MKTIKQLAVEALAKFEWKKRDDRGFWSVEIVEDWIAKMCHDAHSGMLPDDHKYEFIRDALSDIANLKDSATAEDARKIEVEVDIYTQPLLQWLASNLLRVDYCDAAFEDGFVSAADFSTTGLLQAGQMLERREVLNLVIDALEAHAEEVAS